ncbi:MAG: dienelactone hydrolase family protein [Ignavibacterium sp.]|jgi:dienelactone hydrolase|nr:dienelactone hydrolase family protein [Ignavibacterium sp.]
MKLKSVLVFLFGLLLFSCVDKQNEKNSLVEKSIEYSAEGVKLKGYLVYDDDVKGKRPGVLVVHEWWGLNDYAKRRARMLAELGYTAFALDMYGEGKNTDNPEEAQNLAMSVYQNMTTGEERFLAAYNFLKNYETTDSNKIAAIGYCFGGSIVLQMARVGTDLKAVVSFHGGLQPVTSAEKGKVNAFILVCNGAADKSVTPEQIQDFKTEMDNAGVHYSFINYEGALHAFSNPEADSLGKKFNMPIAYNKKADIESWQEMVNLFKQVFKK